MSTSIATGFDITAKWRGKQYRNRVFLCNGRNRMRTWDGVNLFNAGIERLATAPTLATIGGGTLTGAYYYYYVPVNTRKINTDGRVVAGIPSPISAVVNPSGQGVRVTLPSSHPDGQVDRLFIFRNKAGAYLSDVEPEQQDFFYIGNVTIGVTTYDDVTAAASGIHADNTLTGQEKIRFNQAIPATFKFMEVFGDRIFGMGFDPISGGDATVNASPTLIDFSGIVLPDGVVGCWFKKVGDSKQYRITAYNSTTQITLSEAFVGTLSFAPYLIYRYPWEIYFTEFNDPEACGPNGEAFRYLRNIPGNQKGVGHIAAQGALYVFTQNNIYAINGKGPESTAVNITPDPVFPGIGAVSGDSIFSVEDEVWFMSLRGPAVIRGGRVELIGQELNTDWLDVLTSTEMGYICGGSDGSSCWFAYPVSGETGNSLIWRYDRPTGTWWQETGASPVRMYNDKDQNGIEGRCYMIDGATSLLMDEGSLDNVDSILSPPILTIENTTSITCDTSTFNILTGGEWVYIYAAATSATGARFIARRRITSITGGGARINWSSSSSDPGGGELTLDGTETIVIGRPQWRWRSRTVQAPAHWSRIINLSAEFEGKTTDTTTIGLHKTDYVDGVAASVTNGPFLNNDYTKEMEVNEGGRDYSVLLESRTGAVLRQVTARGITQEGPY